MKDALYYPRIISRFLIALLLVAIITLAYVWLK